MVRPIAARDEVVLYELDGVQPLDAIPLGFEHVGRVHGTGQVHGQHEVPGRLDLLDGRFDDLGTWQRGDDEQPE